VSAKRVRQHRDDEEGEEDEEHDLRDTREGRCEATETKDGGEKSNGEQNQGQTKHWTVGG